MLIQGGQVFDLEKGFVERDLCTDGKLIAQTSGDEIVLDATGCYVIPGLVDVHFHGAVVRISATRLLMACRLWQTMSCPRV